jgi:hypothetical protein
MTAKLVFQVQSSHGLGIEYFIWALAAEGIKTFFINELMGSIKGAAKFSFFRREESACTNLKRSKRSVMSGA